MNTTEYEGLTDDELEARIDGIKSSLMANRMNDSWRQRDSSGRSGWDIRDSLLARLQAAESVQASRGQA